MATQHAYYLETSVWGMIPRGQPRELRRATLRLLNQHRDFVVSPAVLAELSAAKESLRNEIMELFDEVGPRVVSNSSEVIELAAAYLEAGVVPPKKRDDAIHVATATVHRIDVLVSWNHRHIANVRKSEQYRGVNLLHGYGHLPVILTPFEVLYA